MCACTSDLSQPAEEEEDVVVHALFYVSLVCRLEDVAMLLTTLNRHHLLMSDLCKHASVVS